MAAVARGGDNHSKKSIRTKSTIEDEPKVYPEPTVSVEEEVAALTRAADIECDDGEKLCDEEHALTPED